MDEALKDMPEILYKYRDFKNDFHQRLLFNQELYFTSASKFNDPFDASLPYKYKEDQLTEANIFLKYYSVLKREHPKWGESEIHEAAYQAQRKGLMKDDIQQERFNENINKDINNTFGIVSLSETPNDILMWSHYANSHTGFCVGLDSKFISQNFNPVISLHQIICQNEIPRIDLFEDPIIYFIKILCTKSKCWEYEKEFRLVYRDFVNKSLDITEWAIKEVYLGAKMPHLEKQALIKKLIAQYSSVKVFECSLSKSNFAVDLMRVA